MRRLRALSTPAGFTLLEVVVALAMLALLLPTALGIVALGLRAIKASSDTSAAVLLARRQLDALAYTAASPAAADGVTGAYRWTSDVHPDARLVRLRVRVQWEQRGREQSLELATLRPAPPVKRPAVLTP
jgi:prepilin-type N-terminal cleavage/methylation domain-containing protein